MATIGGPNIVEDGLVLALDAANSKGISPAANEEFNNSDQFIKNMVDSSYTITTNNGVKIGNLNYYTAFGIQYPEGNYGGAAAGRDGITAGFNVTSGTKLYDCSRDLNMFVFNDDTETWVPDSYFNGERVNGHCYDTYDGQPSQHATFQSDYDNIKATFPNVTFIIIGSHAAENNDNDSGTLSRLQELGFPDSQIGVGRPEYILVAKPNVKNYIYAYENYSVNPGQVAHAVFPLPINKVNKDNYFEFDGTNDYIRIDHNGELNFNSSDFTAINWCRVDGSSGTYRALWQSSVGVSTTRQFGIVASTNDKWGIWMTINDVFGNRLFSDTSVVIGEWIMVTVVYRNNESLKLYLNGVEDKSVSISGNLTYTPTVMNLGARFNTAEHFNGRIATGHLYNRALTASEVLQNYNATKGRFGL